MALSKAAKAALIAGGLYGLYRMLGKDQDGSKVPVEDRNTIRKTIAAADKKEDKKSASSARNEQAGLAAAAPSVKDKPTVKPAAKKKAQKKYTIEPYMDPSTVKPMPMGGGRGRAAGATAKDLASMRSASPVSSGRGRARGATAADLASIDTRSPMQRGKDYLDRKQSELAGSRGARILAAQDAALRASTMPNPKLASLAARRDGTRAMRDAAVLDRQRDARDAAAMQRFRAAQEQERYGMGMKAGKEVKKYSSGKSVTKGRGDGMAQRGKTKGRMC
jgi:hypothetical protein